MGGKYCQQLAPDDDCNILARREAVQAAQAAAQDSSLAAQQQSVAAECQLAAAQVAFAAASPAIPVDEVEASSPFAAHPESGSANHAEQAAEVPQTVSADAVATGAAEPEVGQGTAGELKQLQSNNAELRQQLAVALLQLSAARHRGATPRCSGSSHRSSGDACSSPPRSAPPAGAGVLQFASPGGSAILGGSSRASGRGYMSDEGQDGYYTAGEVLLLPMSLHHASS